MLLICGYDRNAVIFLMLCLMSLRAQDRRYGEVFVPGS
jgi:hypothetical protein